MSAEEISVPMQHFLKANAVLSQQQQNYHNISNVPPHVQYQRPICAGCNQCMQMREGEFMYVEGQQVHPAYEHGLYVPPSQPVPMYHSIEPAFRPQWQQEPMYYQQQFVPYEIPYQQQYMPYEAPYQGNYSYSSPDKPKQFTIVASGEQVTMVIPPSVPRPLIPCPPIRTTSTSSDSERLMDDGSTRINTPLDGREKLMREWIPNSVLV